MPDGEVRYTIAICNYNMKETLEESLLSILNQVEDRPDIEVLVVDDGSTDGSTKILRALEDEYSKLRVLYLEDDPNRNLGGVRQISFEESMGEYILESLDTDDIQHEGILDFISVYHEIEEGIGKDFYLRGVSIVMTSKDIVERTPYRNVNRGSDEEHRRRVISNETLISIHHRPIWESIGYDPDFVEQRKIWFEQAVTDFRSGISLLSYMKWGMKQKSPRGLLLFLLAPLAYIKSFTEGRYNNPGRHRDKGKWMDQKDKMKLTLRGIEEELGISIDREELSELGREIFYFE